MWKVLLERRGVYMNVNDEGIDGRLLPLSHSYIRALLWWDGGTILGVQNEMAKFKIQKKKSVYQSRGLPYRETRVTLSTSTAVRVRSHCVHYSRLWSHVWARLRSGFFFKN